MWRLVFIAVVAITLGAMAPDTPKPLPKPLMVWTDLTGRPQPKPDATVSYGADEMQKVDVWLPAGPGPFKTVLMVHGGCWTTSIATRSLMNWIAADLRKSGYAVWNIDYRGVDRVGGGYPGTFADTAAAADALMAHTAEFHLDASHIVAVGHSAGGHLALWLAGRHNLPNSSLLYSPNPIKIAHIISLGGLPDLEATAKAEDNGCGTDVIHRLVGASSDTHRDVYADTSVPRLLPLGVPQDLVNGANDEIIPARMGAGYEAQAKKAGDGVSLTFVPDTGHVELVAPETAAWRKTKRLIAAAFAKR